MKTKRARYPSRMKYDKANPVRSIRLTGDLTDKLQRFELLTGKTLEEILIAAVEQRRPAIEEAYRCGYESAKSRYMLKFQCPACKQFIYLDSEKKKRPVIELLSTWSIGHSNCDKNIDDASLSVIFNIATLLSGD